MTENAKTFDYTNYIILNEEIVYEKDEDGKDVKTVIKIVESTTKKTLTEEQRAERKKKYIKKYTEENREEINKKVLEINKNRYKNDEEYREYIKQKRKEYYQKTKK
jgi:hypothetical protein